MIPVLFDLLGFRIGRLAKATKTEMLKMWINKIFEKTSVSHFWAIIHKKLWNLPCTTIDCVIFYNLGEILSNFSPFKGRKLDFFRVGNFVIILKVSREKSACAIEIIRVFIWCMLGNSFSFTIVTQESELKSLSKGFKRYFHHGNANYNALKYIKWIACLFIFRLTWTLCIFQSSKPSKWSPQRSRLV